jgi:hypothetical protein
MYLFIRVSPLFISKTVDTFHQPQPTRIQAVKKYHLHINRVEKSQNAAFSCFWKNIFTDRGHVTPQPASILDVER